MRNFIDTHIPPTAHPRDILNVCQPNTDHHALVLMTTPGLLAHKPQRACDFRFLFHIDSRTDGAHRLAENSAQCLRACTCDSLVYRRVVGRVAANKPRPRPPRLSLMCPLTI